MCPVSHENTVYSNLATGHGYELGDKESHRKKTTGALPDLLREGLQVHDDSKALFAFYALILS